jgi:hypothetical protein
MGKNLEGNGYVLIEVLSRYLPGDSEQNLENSVRLIFVQTTTRTNDNVTDIRGPSLEHQNNLLRELYVFFAILSLVSLF